MEYFVRGFALAITFPFFIGVVQIVKLAFRSGVSFSPDGGE